MPNPIEQTSNDVDWFIFSSGVTILLAVCVPIILWPETSTAFIEQLFGYLTRELGVLYIIAAGATFIFLLYLGFSRHGNTRFGDIKNRTYSNFSWASMLFCAGIGASLLYWGATEWVFYYTSPPFSVEPRSAEAVLWASSYGVFHWGPIGWALYCLPAITLGYSYHIRRLPALRLSSACDALLPGYIEKWPGRIIDLLFIVGLLATCATGLGFGTNVVASAISRLTGVADELPLQLSIIAFATVIIAISVGRGMERGIKVLSLINANMAIVMVAFIFLLGPSQFILEMAVTSLGHLAQNFVLMMTWTDPLGKASFVEDWTVFYWAWWLALGPFVGMFVCKISEGRTVREVIFGMLGWGSLGCATFFIILGNFSMHLELEGLYPVVDEALNISPAHAMTGVIQTLPFGNLWLVFLGVIALIFIATSYDSASYTLAAGATRNMSEHEHPARWHRVFWAFALGVLPVCLLFLGGLKVLQTASIVASLPILGVYLLLGLSTLKMARHESPTRSAET